jgi:hypothetical protein
MPVLWHERRRIVRQPRPQANGTSGALLSSDDFGSRVGGDVHVSCRQYLNASGSLLFIGRQTDDFGKATSEVKCISPNAAIAIIRRG